ncbi:MAG: hypothetical protein FJ216_01475 [Ignavibacteria bacterium]|nr:hypothetical protein [Ignavibacteria bacterium]
MFSEIRRLPLFAIDISIGVELIIILVIMAIIALIFIFWWIDRSKSKKAYKEDYKKFMTEHDISKLKLNDLKKFSEKFGPIPDMSVITSAVFEVYENKLREYVIQNTEHFYSEVKNLRDIIDIELKEKNRRIKSDKKIGLGLYKEILDKFLEDNILTKEELDKLNEIKEYFSLDLSETKALIEQKGKDKFSGMVDDFLQDGFLSDEEKKYLIHSVGDLKITSDEAKAIFLLKAKEKLEQFGNSLIEKAQDEMISDDDFAEFLSMAVNFNVSSESFSRFDVLKNYNENYNIEHGIIKAVEPDEDILESGEKCFYIGPVNLYTHKIIGSVEEHSPEIRGKIYLTNKRLIVKGIGGIREIPFRDIVVFLREKEGVIIIETVTKHDYYILFTEEGDKKKTMKIFYKVYKEKDKIKII